MTGIVTKISVLLIFSISLSQGRNDVTAERNSNSHHTISSLVDKATGLNYLIEAYFDGEAQRGRVDIKQGSSSYSLFYSDQKVLAFYNNLCTVHRLENNGLDEKLPDDGKGIIALILFIKGPMIHTAESYTLVSNSIESKPFRGWPEFRVVKSYWNGIEFNQRYPVDRNGEPHGRTSLVIEIAGQNPEINSEPVQLTLNTHFFERMDDSMKDYLIPTTGIGCPSQLEPNQPRPSYRDKKFRYFTRISQTNRDAIYREVSIDNDKKIQRYKTYLEGQMEESIVDGMLSTEFKFNKTMGCEYGSIGNLQGLWGDIKFNYVGQMICGNRRILCDIWESVENKVDLNKVTYEKVVTTIFIAKEEIDGTPQPIEVVKTGYEKDETSLKKSYIEKEEIFDFGEIEWIPFSEIAECFPESEQRRYFQLYIKPESTQNAKRAVEVASKNPVAFKNGLFSLILGLSRVSFSRFPEMELSFLNDTIVASLMLVERPHNIPGYLNLDFILTSLKAGLYYIDKTRYTLHDNSITPNGESFTFHMEHFVQVPAPFVLDDEFVEGLILFPGTKLILKESRSQLIPVKRNLKSLADCYRACKNSTEMSCRMFSYCSNKDGIECTITSEYTEATDSNDLIIESSECSIYRKEFLIDFAKYGGRMFVGEELTPLPGKFSPEECAKECFLKSDQCQTFQQCADQEQCFLINHTITDGIKEVGWSNGLCSLYGENHFEKYTVTGSYLVSDYFVDENAYTAEECAGRCYHSTEKPCPSFNYCPESNTQGVGRPRNNGRSCQLSEKRVDSPGVKTVKSTLCLNYQLVEDESPEKQHANQNVSLLPSRRGSLKVSTMVKVSGFKSFGIIMAFAVAGLITGAVGFTLWKSYPQRRNKLSLNDGFRNPAYERNE